MSKKLSRRDFLKLAGTTSAGLALSACGVKVTELPMATFVLPTATLRPTNTPEPSLPILNTGWAGKEGSTQIDLTKLFDGVVYGGQKLRRTIDLSFGSTKLGVVLDQEILSNQNYRELKESVALGLDNNQDLKKRILEIQNYLAKLPEFGIGNDFSNLTLIIEDASITTAILRSGSIISKYRVNADNSVESFKKGDEPQILSNLEVNEGKFSFVAEDEPIRLTGAAMHHYLWTGNEYLDRFKTDLKLLRVLGANYIYVSWNSGHAIHKNYRSRLVEDIEYARQLGFRIELVLSYNYEPQDPENDGPTNLVSEKLVEYWDRLLSDPDIASRLRNTVDIYGITNEPLFYLNRNVHLTWNVWLPLAERVVDLIRKRIGKGAICGISGHNGGGTIIDAINNPSLLENITYEIHIYQHMNQWTPVKSNWYPATGKTMYHCSEIGAYNEAEIPYITTQLEYLRDNGIGFAAFGGVSFSNNDVLLIFYPNGDLTDYGKLVSSYFDSSYQFR